MEITEVKVFPIQEEKLKAFVSVVFDQCFMVNDIKVIQGREGLFISMPSRRKKNGEFKDVAHPLNNETRRMIETRILTEYEQLVSERGDSVGTALVSGSPVEAAVGEREIEPSQPLTEPIATTATNVADQPLGLAAGAETVNTVVEAESPHEEKSLEEVEEMHLRDSFWSVR